MDDQGRGPGILGSTVIHFVAEAIAIWVATAIVPGVHVLGGVVTYLWIAILFGVINAVVGTVLRLLTLPLIVLTLGLLSFAITVAMLALTAWLSSKLEIDGFWSAVGAAFIVAVVSAVVEAVTRRALRRSLAPRPQRVSTTRRATFGRADAPGTLEAIQAPSGAGSMMPSSSQA